MGSAESTGLLIVDDLKVNRMIVRSVVSDALLGLEIYEAADGRQALDLLERERIHAVILDIVMPEMDGLEVLERMMAHPLWREIPVIMFSVLGETESVEKALSLGAQDYFTKPLTKEQIRITLKLKVRNVIRYAAQRKKLLHYQERMKGELQVAKQLQMSMITENGRFQNLQLEGRYIPCEEVGGDFYSCKEQNGRVWFMIADVAGHGVSAAMLATMLKAVFQSSIRHCRTPGEVLESINQSFLEDFVRKTLISAFVGCVEPSGALHYANAGHPYPLLYRERTDSWAPMQPGGFLLGMFDDCAYGTYAVQLEPGDCLLLYTDGLYENGGRGRSAPSWRAVLEQVEGLRWSGDDEAAGEGGNTESIAELGDAAGLPARLIRAFEAVAGAAFTDDVAVLTLSFVPPDGLERSGEIEGSERQRD